jgi:single-strand DNA-binding protein
MSSLNKAIIIGNLGRDPESKTTGSGMTITNFSVATSDKHKGEERTEWHRVVAFGKTAEICAQYLRKGSQVCVEGKIQTRDWEGKDGQKRYTTEIIAQNVQFIGGGGGQRRNDSPAPTQGGDFNQSFNDDDIPF